MGLLDQLFGLSGSNSNDWVSKMQAQMTGGPLVGPMTANGGASSMVGAKPPQAGERKMFPAPDAPKAAEDAGASPTLLGLSGMARNLPGASPSAPRMNLGGPAPAATFEPDTPGTLSSALRGFAGEGGGFGILGAIGNATRNSDEAAKQRSTFDALVAGGVEPRTAELLIKQPETYKVAEALKTQNKKTQLTTQTAQFLANKFQLDPVQAQAIAQDPELLRKYLQPGGAQGSTKYGTTVHFDKDGKPYVIGEDGTSKALDANLLPPDELARAKAGGTLTGKTVAQAKADLPRIESNAAKFLNNLEMIENDPKFNDMTGPVDTWRPNVSGSARRFQSRIDQTMGESFLEAFGSLKGGGQITEIEGVKATQAITRLGETGMNEDDYRQAITELKTIVRNGVIRARVQAGLLPESELSKVIDLERLGVPNATQTPPTTPQNRAGPGQPLAGASGKSRIIGVE